MTSVLLVSIGAIVGVNIRYIIFEKLYKIRFKKDLIVFLINSFASFAMGFFSSILLNHNFMYSDQLVLFFLIGCLGSLSTFSTFMSNLFELSFQLKYYRALKICFLSLLSGLLLLAFGYFLGTQ